MSRAQNALTRLYENADLRDELTDDEANAMFKWAEAELARLDAASPDDASFEAQADTLMDLLKKMNRFAGRQGQVSAQGVDPAPTNIAGLATELGHPASAEQIAAAGTGDPASTITALTVLMSVAPASETPDAETTTKEASADVQPSQPATTDTPPAETSPPSFGDYIDEYDL
jgi:hypothetical protein